MKESYQAQNPVTGGLDQVKTNPFDVEDEIIGPSSEADPQLCYIAVKNDNDEWESILAIILCTMWEIGGWYYQC